MRREARLTQDERVEGSFKSFNVTYSLRKEFREMLLGISTRNSKLFLGRTRRASRRSRLLLQML